MRISYFTIILALFILCSHISIAGKYEELQNENTIVSISPLSHTSSQLPLNDQDYSSLMLNYWKGEELYKKEQYNDSIVCFLSLQEQRLPSAVKYLYHFIDHQDHYVQKGVSLENFDKIKSKLGDKKQETLFKEYQEIFAVRREVSEKTSSNKLKIHLEKLFQKFRKTNQKQLMKEKEE